MTKKLDTDEFILKTLQNGPLSLKEIIDLAKYDSDFKAPIKKESYYEAFNKFLYFKTIQIDDYKLPEEYDPRKKDRIQSMKPDNIIFSLVRTEFIDILDLILQLNKENYNDLFKLFKIKITEIENTNLNKWESLVKNIIIRNPRGEELLILEGEKEPYSFLIAHSYLLDDWEIEDFDISKEIEEYKKNQQRIIEKYSKTKVYFLEHPKNEKEIDPLTEQILTLQLNKDKKATILLSEEDLGDFPYEKKISDNGVVNKELYLNSLGFIKPKKRSYRELETIFGDIFSYLNSQNSNNAAIQLSRGLSDQIKSEQILNEIVLEATKNKEQLIFEI